MPAWQVPGSVLTEDLIFWLTALHLHYRNKIVFAWDNLGGHKAAEDTASLTAATIESAQKISDDAELIRSFFDHAGLPI